VTALEKAGLALMLIGIGYGIRDGVRLCSWFDLVLAFRAIALTYGGALLWVGGDALTRWLKRRWPGVPW
jgi:hypothetical protein